MEIPQIIVDRVFTDNSHRENQCHSAESVLPAAFITPGNQQASENIRKNNERRRSMKTKRNHAVERIIEPVAEKSQPFSFLGSLGLEKNRKEAADNINTK